MEEQQEMGRLRLPRKGEIVGVVTGMLGAGRMAVSCSDKKERVCRVPGKIKRQIWVREEDWVIVEPWEIDDGRGDIVWRYTRLQADWLKRKGYIKV